MKLLDDPKIPTARRNPQTPHHSYKLLDVVAEMGLKPERPYCTRRRHYHLRAVPTNFDPKNEEQSFQNKERSPLTDEDRDTPRLYGLRATQTGDLRRRREADWIAWRDAWGVTLRDVEKYVSRFTAKHLLDLVCITTDVYIHGVSFERYTHGICVLRCMHA
jgi:hypothetical protein